MPEELHDAAKRHINYVRISLTDRCNYRCVFCMPKDGIPFVPHADILRYDQLLRLAAIFATMGICHCKVTGGEPFCRKDAVEFIEALSSLPGVQDVTLTTNGSLVEPHLERLARCGVRSITFSLPSLRPQTYDRITRSGFTPKDILRVMDKARSLGLMLKTNTVPLIGFNEADIIPLARYALERGHTARFIELMPVGSGKACSAVPQSTIHAMLEAAFGTLIPQTHKMGNGPAKVYGIVGYPGHVGFIAAMTDKFCATCNRVRLTSRGFFKTCLYHDSGVDMKKAMDAGADDAQLAELVRQAIRTKPRSHQFSFDAASGAVKHSGATMNAIGG
ncbi:MAG: GTP 3',8-cyclase MoaA [Desulfovibrio sp.]|nr:GTP 3',8-cyclase MoaA [Desulfovibrio sp.]